MTKTESKVRTRFAPSPTGELHIGGTRTALFNYLYAKHHQGTFILRFEDTDLDRNINTTADRQYQDLLWLNITPDESYKNPNQKYGSYFQSERKKIYLEYAQKLIKDGYAYYSSSENEAKLEALNSNLFSKKIINSKPKTLSNTNSVVRLKIKKDLILCWDDRVFGKTKVNSNELKDFVLIKSDGTPSYNFANVVDDHLFEITDVIRGQEHISNTPKQLLLYQYFGWTPPKYCHVSLILNQKTNKKLSKRDNDVLQFISQYRQENYLPAAVNNFLLFLGWYHPEKEVFTHQEMIKLFSLKNLNKAPSFFDLKKLLWFNQEHLKSMPYSDFLDYSQNWLLSHGYSLTPIVKKGLLFLKPQLQKIDYFLDKGDVFLANVKLDQSGEIFLKDHINERDLIILICQELKKRLSFFDPTSSTFQMIIKDLFNQFKKEFKVESILFYKTLRLATTRRIIGSPLFQLWDIIGKKELLLRIEDFFKILKKIK